MESTLPALDEAQERFFPFLVEIRKRLLFVVLFFVFAAAIGFLQYEKIVRFILSVYKLDGVNIVFTSPFQFMNLAVSSALLMGIVSVFPLIVFQFLSFIRPALKKKEYLTVVYLIPLSLVLFVFGFGIGSVMMRYVVELFYEKSLSLEIGNFLDISQLLSQIIVTSALMGAAFQFPIVLTLLVQLGIVKIKVIAQQRLIAYGTSLLFAALLPPTDVFSLVMLTAPLIVLFELTVVLNKYIFKKK